MAEEFKHRKVNRRRKVAMLSPRVTEELEKKTNPLERGEIFILFEDRQARIGTFSRAGE